MAEISSFHIFHRIFNPIFHSDKGPVANLKKRITVSGIVMSSSEGYQVGKTILC